MHIPKVKLKAIVSFIALLLLITPTQAFFRHLCRGELGNGRVDALMAPGQPSQHLHVLFGASNMGFDPSLDDLLASNCTSCSIKQDHSVYWSPRMYFQHDNGTFEMVATAGGSTVYYFTEPDNVYKDKVVAFPQNFRMIAGDSLKRTFYGPNPDPPMSEWQGSDMTQQALGEKALGFNCLNYSTGAVNEGTREYHYMRNKTFLDSQCLDGIRAEVMFPSCWNGKDLDSDNHTTHVAYPSGVQTGKCPDGFPVRLPSLLYETIYQTDLFKGIAGQFVFSNGDPTGYGYHGDFICGWEEGVLQSAIDNPACNLPQETSGEQDQCPVFAGQLENLDAEPNCHMEIPEALQSEEINMIAQLPGNVQIAAGPAPATIGSEPGATGPPANTAAPPSPANPSPGPTAAMSTSSPDPTLTPCTQDRRTTTTSYMSDGVMVNLVIIEEVVTVTVSNESTPTANANRKRQKHKHGHHHGRL